MRSAIERGMDQERLWKTLDRRLERRRRLVDSERRHLQAQQNTITAEQAMTLMHRIVDTVIRYVPDPHARQHIVRDLRVLLGPSERKAPDLN
jgi:hypothetical protein